MRGWGKKTKVRQRTERKGEERWQLCDQKKERDLKETIAVIKKKTRRGFLREISLMLLGGKAVQGNVKKREFCC